MPPRKKVDDDIPLDLPPPAKTLEGREEQLIAAAVDLVEKRIHRGDASAQEVVHFLKLGSVRAQLENDKIRSEKIVLEARVKEMEARRGSDELYSRALEAFKGYSGQTYVDPDALEEEEYDPHL